MSNDIHTQNLENIPAYVLGSLDADERQSLELHLKDCEWCQAELVSYRNVSENLLLAATPHDPPVALRKRIQARLPSAQKANRRRFTWPLSQFGIAAVITLLIVVNIFSFSQILLLRSQQNRLLHQVETSQIAMAMLSYPDTQTISLDGQGIVGTLLLDKNRNIALLTIWNLPQVQTDQTYQIWLIDPQGERTSAGVFQPESELPFTSASIYSHDELTDYVGLGVTIEPAGGSDEPTGERLFIVDF